MDLTTSFGLVLEPSRPDGIGSGRKDDECTDAAGLLVLCERELQPVVGSLTQVIDGKDALLKSVRHLATETDALARWPPKSKNRRADEPAGHQRRHRSRAGG